MTLSRRHFLGIAFAGAALSSAKTVNSSPVAGRGISFTPIDRKALVTRHNPILRKFDPLSPLSLGNGEFAFTADVTGLQTFPTEYDNSMPLCTMSQWGWHTTPLPSGLDPNALRLNQYDTHGRAIGYHTSSEGQTELFNWLRENPHRLHLGRIGLHLTKGDVAASASDISNIQQQLDLWSGTLNSFFYFAGEQISVSTAVHPDHDLLTVEINSRLVREGGHRRLAV